MVHPIAQIAFSASCNWFLFHLSNKDAILKHAQLRSLLLIVFGFPDLLFDIVLMNREVAGPSTQPIGQVMFYFLYFTFIMGLVLLLAVLVGILT